MKVLVFANQKGGVGKTTSAVNIAAALGILGKRTLLIDFDPQGNASSAVGVRKAQVTSYDVIIGRHTAESAIIETEYKNLHVIPAKMALAGAEFELVDLEHREARLKNALEPIRDNYDYAIIDCPPSLGLLTINALTCGDGVIIPMQCEYFSLEGLSQMMQTIKQVKNLYNPKLTLTGILITMYNGRLNLSISVLDELKKYYADKLFKSAVQRNVRRGDFGKDLKWQLKKASSAEDLTQYS